MGIVMVDSGNGKYAELSCNAYTLNMDRYSVAMFVNNVDGAAPYWVDSTHNLTYDDAVVCLREWMDSPLRLPNVVVNGVVTDIQARTVHAKDPAVVYIHAGQFCELLGIPKVRWDDLYTRGNLDDHGYVSEKRLHDLIGNDFGEWFVVPEDDGKQ